MTDDLTPGQAAKFLDLSARTVTNLIDSGRLPGWKIPNSTHRRIKRVDLVEFMRQREMNVPTELLDSLPEFRGRTTADMCENLIAFSQSRIHDAEKLKSDCYAIAVSYQTLELAVGKGTNG